jgi:hypothetical protein
MAEYILNEMFIEPERKVQDVSPIEEIYEDNPFDKMSIDDMRTEFPHLIRNGDYVKAMEIIQGHGRFNWFYGLVFKISDQLFGKKQGL